MPRRPPAWPKLAGAFSGPSIDAKPLKPSVAARAVRSLPLALADEEDWRETLGERAVALERLKSPGNEVRRERELAEQLLARRSAEAVAITRIEPPPYIVKELGERPTDPTKARAWDHAVEGIESYLVEHGITDKGSVLGPEPPDASTRAIREIAQQRLAETQRRLELEQRIVTREMTRSIGRDMGIGL